jgi:hypothetical protein
MGHKDGWLGFRCVAETDNVMLSRDGAIPVSLLTGGVYQVRKERTTLLMTFVY